MFHIYPEKYLSRANAVVYYGVPNHVDQVSSFSSTLNAYFLCPHHKMAEGQIEFTMSARARVCVFSFVRLCVPESCPTHNFIVHGVI